MKFLKVKNKRLSEGSFRFDATFHLSEGVNFRKIIENSGFQTMKIGDVVDQVFYGGRDRRIYVETPEKGLPFMGSADMLKNDFNNLKLISKKLTKNIGNYKLKKEWILVSRSGTIGNMAYTNADFEGLCASEHIIRIVPKSNIFSGYLYSYLSSKYGYSLLTQGTFGNVIQHIEPDHIENIPIPILPEEFQQKIHNLIVESAQLRVEANKLLREAVEIFEKEIGESKVTHSFQVGKISSNKIYGFHKRFDSQYQLGWNALDKEKKNNLEYIKLAQVACNIFVGGRGKRNYVENGVPFLSSSDMMLFNPKRNCKKISGSKQGIESMKVSLNDILISRSGTVGNTVIVGKDLQDTVISEHALRLVVNPEKISPLYVFTFLKTKYGLKTMESSSFGSVIITLNEDLIGNIEMPILEEHLQSEIEKRTEKYISNLDLSTELENQAIDLIEKEIDQWQQ